MRRLAVLPLVVALVGCGFTPEPTAALCEVARELERAYDVAREALQFDRARDADRARQLASQASRMAKDANERLDAVDGDATVRSDAYQALLMGYLRVGQAAHALLPEFEGTYGITAEELDRARVELDAADAALGGC